MRRGEVNKEQLFFQVWNESEMHKSLDEVRLMTEVKKKKTEESNCIEGVVDFFLVDCLVLER